ncbi:zinc finger protein 638 isoform X2 [Lissotriton helveticus]
MRWWPLFLRRRTLGVCGPYGSCVCVGVITSQAREAPLGSCCSCENQGLRCTGPPRTEQGTAERTQDWIQHQNTTTHIESCRQIRSKYPDWNPQALGALRNETDKDRSPRGRSGSGSSSPRHPRSSGSSHRLLRSRSPDKFTRPRSLSRSPRRAVRRSPRRSRSPRRISRISPRYRKTLSGERTSRKTSRTPEKKSSDTFRSGSKTELGKHRNGKSSTAAKRIQTKPESTGLRKPGSESTSARRPGFAARYPSNDCTSPRKSSTSSDRASSKRLPSSSSQKQSSSSTLSKKSGTDGTAKKPVSSTSLEEKSVTPTDESKKSHDKRKPGNMEAVVVTTPAPPPPTPKEAYHSLPWFKNKMDPGTVIHITDLPDDGYTDQDILKVVQPFGKASDILIIRCKNEAYLEMSFREAAIAAIKFSETVPVMINKKRVRLSSVGQKPQPAIVERRVMPVVAQKKEAVKNVPSKKQATFTKPLSDKPPEKSLKPDFSQPKQANKVNPKANVEKVPDVSKSTTAQKIEDTSKDVPGQKMNVKPMKKEVDYGVILVTNFPEKEYTAEEVANLAKPFGGVKDVILLSSHKQAYLQMSQSSAESMIKFYTVFPMSLAGKQLSIKLVPKYKSIKDVERIFADIIEAEESKPRPEIHEEFVHLKNLPKEGYTDLEVAYVGLRFGKVNNYVVIRNKRKAILHLDSAKNARAMYNFLLNYPCNLANTTLKCTLSPKRKPLPGETVIAEESDAGSEVENIDETECAQMVSNGSAKTKLADTNTDHSSASSIQTSNSKPDSKNNELHPAKNIQKGETEEKVVTLSSKPLVKPGVVKKKLIKKKSAVALEPFAKTLKFKRIALKPKVVKKTKPKGIDTVTDQAQGLEDARKINAESASTPELATDRVGLDSQNSADLGLNGGVNQPVTDPKGTVDDGRKTGAKNEVESGNNYQNRSEKIPQKASEKNTNRDQTPVEVRNPSTARSGVSKKGISSNQSSTTVTAKQGGLTQKMTSTKSGEDQKPSSRPDVSITGARNAGKESCAQRSGSSSVSSSTSKPSMSVSRRNTGKSVSTVQEKDGRGGSRSMAKSQERDDRLSTSKDDQNNKSSGKRSPKTARSAEPKESLEDHEMFPFNMDEFVTVDEIVEETVEEETTEKSEEAGKSLKISETVKRNESGKDSAPKDTSSKKRESSTASKQDHSFVTLDEVGEEDAFAAQPEASPEDMKQHQTPINEHKKNQHVGKAPHSVMTLDEVSDEEDFVDGKASGKVQRIATDSRGKRAGLAVGRVKAVEDTKASKASNNGACSLHEEVRTGVKAGVSQMVIDEPVLVTVDEFNEEDDDFMNNLFSEEHQFVTVDEIGDEDDEDDKPHDEMKAAHKSETLNSTKPTSKKGESKKHEGLTSQTEVRPHTRSSTSAKPEERSVDKSTIGKRNLRSESKSPAATPKKRQQVEEMQEQSNLNTAAADHDSKDASKDEVESKRRKLDLPAKLLPYDPKIAVGLEFLIPKTGYFCELCSLFYMDDSSKIKHCKTLRHYNCVEKHMAEQQEIHLTEDSSSAVQEKL